jgi:uncharacterized repeat protein (TIGR03837 family)
VQLNLFCSVIDNFGDIGVCWRLARQLRAEYGCLVTLWVDDWRAARALIPALPERASAAQAEGVAIRPWHEAVEGVDCLGDVLIEGFGCTPPAVVLSQLRARGDSTLWLNLEYFSAEAWVPSVHGLSGYIAEQNARRWFFVPGVAADSGGLLRERDLLQRRDAWTARDAAQFTQALGLASRAGERVLLCFAYRDAPYDDLSTALSNASSVTRLWLCGQPSQAGVHDGLRTNLPRCSDIPFVPQAQFDPLLWSADVLLVRGEDSLVRALWSAKPFIWQPYPQDDAAHLPKLEAWLTHYTREWPADLAEALRAAHAAWNRAPHALDFSAAWRALDAHFDDWQQWAARSSARESQAPDLARRLMDFVRSHAKAAR